jgi:hypothetical protein
MMRGRLSTEPMAAKIEDHKIDRSGWTPGPWDGEPDRIEWRDAAGTPCLIVRNDMGALCGYAAVAPGHPWYQKEYGDCVYGCAELKPTPLEPIGKSPVPESIQKRHMSRKRFACAENYSLHHTPEALINVHGGLTYSGSCRGAICHVPQPGEPDPVWWFGFDCSHAWDVTPGMDAALRKAGSRLPDMGLRDSVYRDAAYVRLEVERLAEQLRAATK